MHCRGRNFSSRRSRTAPPGAIVIVSGRKLPYARAIPTTPIHRVYYYL